MRFNSSNVEEEKEPAQPQKTRTPQNRTGNPEPCVCAIKTTMLGTTGELEPGVSAIKTTMMRKNSGTAVRALH